ncbi:MAG TPA: Maf family protein [Ignavibacteria bacterium]|nr:Maf family protein [Ignavibacteria bacterium]
MTFKEIFSRKYVLASKSQRRNNLLKQIGLDFIAVDSKAEEINSGNYSPLDVIRFNSINKSKSVSQNYKNEIVISADTIVVLDEKILNKPEDEQQAADYLKQLSNKTHLVFTGFNLVDTQSKKEIFDYEITKVHFRNLHKDEINFYVETYKPLDKAGAYGIQDDFGCLFIDKIEGDYYNVVGLPLVKMYENLKKM